MTSGTEMNPATAFQCAYQGSNMLLVHNLGGVSEAKPPSVRAPT
jgi:hypothetical protein